MGLRVGFGGILVVVVTHGILVLDWLFVFMWISGCGYCYLVGFGVYVSAVGLWCGLSAGWVADYLFTGLILLCVVSVVVVSVGLFVVSASWVYCLLLLFCVLSLLCGWVWFVLVTGLNCIVVRGWVWWILVGTLFLMLRCL